ncbi:hypothetical protein MP228_008629 [Amoeboaphelidium protococcarum]|nr:hypothetical protein MP228_008629 [Amoeboaphelidium protococcarum]
MSLSALQQPPIAPSEFARKRNIKLVMRQQPRHSRVCGQDRRPIDPPPIIQFIPEKARKSAAVDHQAAGGNGDSIGSGDKINNSIGSGNIMNNRSNSTSGDLALAKQLNTTNTRQSLRGQARATGFYKENTSSISSGSSASKVEKLSASHQSYNTDTSGSTMLTSSTDEFSSPLWFMYASLVDVNSGKEITLLKDGKTRSTFGSIVSSLYCLKDLNSLDAGFFVFPDLSIRVDGDFQLKFSLFYLYIDGVGGEKVKFVDSIVSDVFHVYPAKRFPGMSESTELSRLFADQGIKIRIRKELRGRKYMANSVASTQDQHFGGDSQNDFGGDVSGSTTGNQTSIPTLTATSSYNNSVSNHQGQNQNKRLKLSGEDASGIDQSQHQADSRYAYNSRDNQDGSVVLYPRRNETTRMYSLSSQSSNGNGHAGNNSSRRPMGNSHLRNEDSYSDGSYIDENRLQSQSGMDSSKTRPTLPSLNNAFGPPAPPPPPPPSQQTPMLQAQQKRTSAGSMPYVQAPQQQFVFQQVAQFSQPPYPVINFSPGVGGNSNIQGDCQQQQQGGYIDYQPRPVQQSFGVYGGPWLQYQNFQQQQQQRQQSQQQPQQQQQPYTSQLIMGGNGLPQAIVHYVQSGYPSQSQYPGQSQLQPVQQSPQMYQQQQQQQLSYIQQQPIYRDQSQYPMNAYNGMPQQWQPQQRQNDSSQLQYQFPPPQQQFQQYQLQQQQQQQQPQQQRYQYGPNNTQSYQQMPQGGQKQ